MRQMTLLVIATVGCGSADQVDEPVTVLSATVAHESTRDISVWTPDGDGPWPVVYALHGLGGTGQHWNETATALASRGLVVFATDYRSSEAAEQGRMDLAQQDVECGYRFVRSIAQEHGGDLNQPLTIVGHSFGAAWALDVGLNESEYGPEGTYDGCFSGAPRPDVIVAIAGCHYEFEGYSFGFDTSGWANQEANLVVVAGADDDICEPWQSEDATAALSSAGYDVSLVEIADANHLTLIFLDFIDGELHTLPDEPAGWETVQTILDAIAAAAN